MFHTGVDTLRFWLKHIHAHTVKTARAKFTPKGFVYVSMSMFNENELIALCEPRLCMQSTAHNIAVDASRRHGARNKTEPKLTSNETLSPELTSGAARASQRVRVRRFVGGVARAHPPVHTHCGSDGV